VFEAEINRDLSMGAYVEYIALIDDDVCRPVHISSHDLSLFPAVSGKRAERVTAQGTRRPVQQPTTSIPATYNGDGTDPQQTPVSPTTTDRDVLPDQTRFDDY
jgi:hypothetical protein